MCLILFSHNQHPNYKLIVAANRDEFYARPTKPAEFWEEDENILAGKDLEAGGTWMGMTKTGRISMLTNFRDLSNIKADAPTRGHLVSNFLKSEESSEKYMNAIAEKGELYNGFNLISGNIDTLHYYGNYQNGVHKIESGVHGLSNALLDSPWPKVIKGKEKLADIIKSSTLTVDQLFDSLYDDLKAKDKELPDTGVGYDMEKMLSPMFIKSEKYGSRCSTAILVDKNNNVQFAERTYNTNDFTFSVKHFEWKI